MLAVLALVLGVLVLISLPFVLGAKLFLFLGIVTYLIILYLALSSAYTLIKVWKAGLYEEGAYEERVSKLKALSEAIHLVRVRRE